MEPCSVTHSVHGAVQTIYLPPFQTQRIARCSTVEQYETGDFFTGLGNLPRHLIRHNTTERKPAYGIWASWLNFAHVPDVVGSHLLNRFVRFVRAIHTNRLKSVQRLICPDM